MRSHNSSKSAKIASRSMQTTPQNLRYRAKASNGKLQCQQNEDGMQERDFLKVMKEKQVDQWIFNDQRLKFQHLKTKQRYQIRSRISIQRKDNHSKLHLNEDLHNIITPELNDLRIQCPNQLLHQHQKPKTSFASPQVAVKKGYKNEEKFSNMSKHLTQRYAAHPGLKRRRHANTSMQTYPEVSNFLKPTAFSIQLKKPTEFDQSRRSPKRQRMYKATLSPKSKKMHIEDQKNKFMQRQFSFTATAKQKKQQNTIDFQKQKFLLNGWEVESTSFHEFEELYRQKSKELQKIPIAMQSDAFAKKLGRWPFK